MTGRIMHPGEKTSRRPFDVVSAVLLLLGLMTLPLQCLGAHAVDWYVIDACGVADTSPSYRLHAAVGQPVAGTCDGTSYRVEIGYLGRVADTVGPMTDISIRKRVDNANPVEGATIQYTVWCWNNGPSDSTGIQVTDQLPPGVTYVSHSCPGCISYDPVSGVWNLGPVTASGFLRLYITATVDAGTTGQTIVNTASVTASDITDPDPGNDSDSESITVGSGVHYVDPRGSHESPFVSWSTAATNIQDAVDEASIGSMVWVSNGVYATGGSSVDPSEPGLLTSRVYVAEGVVVQSVNGPEVTHIVGAADPATTNGPGAVRCVYLEETAVLSGFTLRNGHTHDAEDADGYGGGVFSNGGIVSNCVIRNCAAHCDGGGAFVDSWGGLLDCTVASNQARNGGGMFVYTEGYASRSRFVENTAGDGGGLYVLEYGEFDTCLFAGNTASSGGGVFFDLEGSLSGCTLAGNHADTDGGGVYLVENYDIYGCILYGNTAGSSGANWAEDFGGGYFSDCCLTPDPGGSGNITADPQFVAAWSGNFRLQGGSPCIDVVGAGPTDLDLVPRPLDGDNNGSAVSDMGCYEFAHENADTDGDGMGDGFEVRFRLDPADGGDALGNLDGDPHSNLQEAVADTDPRDSNAYLRITGILQHPGGINVQWQGGAQARQVLEVRPGLGAGDWAAIHTNEPPTDVDENFTDPSAHDRQQYRINAERP